MVSDNSGDASAYVCGGIHSPSPDRSSDLDHDSPIHPAVTRDIALVHWYDSHGGDSIWTDADKWEFLALTEVVTVGFLINEDDTCIELIQNIAVTGENEQRMNSITIPKSCIIDKKTFPTKWGLTPDN